MNKDMTLEKRLCLNFCPYYKPTKKDEVACMGFVVVKRLLKEEKDIPFKKSHGVLQSLTEESLLQKMCTLCDFYERDCDFTQQRGNSSPCGGFILLGNLLESGIITIDDINILVKNP